MTNQWEQLQNLQGEWRKTLEQGAALGYPHMIRLTQDGETRYFYALKDLGRQEEGQTLAFTQRCLRDDMAVYDVKRVVRVTPHGPLTVATEFQKVDPEKSGLNPSEIMRLVQTILKGETPL